MKKLLLLSTICLLLLTQCGKDSDPFLISKDSIGPINKTTQMRQLDSIFANDSIVSLTELEEAPETRGEVEIYEKGGKKLMLLSPENEDDPNSRITNIQIFDERYITDKGLGLGSTFADVKLNYEIVAIENAINSIVVFLKDSDVFITIDKKQLPENLRYNFSAKVEATQIPETATFKYFMVGWDGEVEETLEE
ncbi:hypothetical protein J1N09_14060 [Aureitalea sp. L0-47]|uniref:hypothetical protein n=1 Tax=Aureitalea sp. L0-47 TaxID=2816962 RepID=UPI0022387089|nr:hypothetical protein [Aureitalea sp. L0-47]MCW5520970.1 hypothetical protein [Aureitalea sp. L0-47]